MSKRLFGKYLKLGGTKVPAIFVDNVERYVIENGSDITLLGDLRREGGQKASGLVRVADYTMDKERSSIVPRLPFRPPFPKTWIEWGGGDVAPTALLVTDNIDTTKGRDPGALGGVFDGQWMYVNDRTAGVMARVFVKLNADSTFSSATVMITEGFFRENWASASDESLKKFNQDFINAICTLLFSLQFLACKNVQRIDKPWAIGLTEEDRAAGKKHSFLKTYLLGIDPGQTRGHVYDGPEGASEEQRRLHICRGRFATYTEERPMFGKLSGTFWVPAHVRGSAQRGVVDKVYEVSPK